MVDTLEEHEILEEILENSKPKLPSDLKNLHYLLFTPFRYPPLQYGSRFGRKHERSIFYASLDLKTAMTETAFYKLAFILASSANLVPNQMQLTSFQVNIATNKGIDLTKNQFNKFKDTICSNINYVASQKLGTAMRESAIEGFISYSSRSKDNGKNINLISPKAFGDNTNIQSTYSYWSCYITHELVEFTSNIYPETTCFNATDFFVNGEFPEIPY